MPFSETSVYAHPPAAAGWRVLVMRRWPRGIRKAAIDEWLPDAAPSADLLRTYRDGALDFAAFGRRYAAEMRARSATLAHLRARERQHGQVVLLCWERPPKPCHRTLLLRLLNRQTGRRRTTR
jgi:uncharacterized protein YeaO (DUF488 family)